AAWSLGHDGLLRPALRRAVPGTASGGCRADQRAFGLYPDHGGGTLAVADPRAGHRDPMLYAGGRTRWRASRRTDHLRAFVHRRLLGAHAVRTAHGRRRIVGQPRRGRAGCDPAMHAGAEPATGFDAAEMDFEDKVPESGVLEDGIVKAGGFHLEQGVGVRALSGEKAGFAYSNAITADALRQGAQAARSIARSGQQGRVEVLKKP